MDPLVAMKIMWNWDYKCTAPMTSTCELRRRHGRHRRQRADDRRAALPPRPLPPAVLERAAVRRAQAREAESQRVSRPAGLYPILEPFDLKGVGALGNRYIDPAKQDDSWLYLPSLRRVRRLSTAQRSDALFGQDTDVDSYYGYSGHIAWMDFKYLGERDLIAPYHAKNYPAKWNERSTGPSTSMGEAPRARRSRASRSCRSTPTASA
jgi:hypothetical protein